MSVKSSATIIHAGEDVVKEHTTLNVDEAVVFSKILPHTPEAGDSYYIGDAYEKIPPSISQEWEIDTYDIHSLASSFRIPICIPVMLSVLPF